MFTMTLAESALTRDRLNNELKRNVDQLLALTMPMRVVFTNLLLFVPPVATLGIHHDICYTWSSGSVLTLADSRGATSATPSELGGVDRRRLEGQSFVGTAMDDEEEESQYINLDDFAGPLREWILLTGPRREIRRRFRSVLTEYERTSGEPT
jgi:hypothetical protein